MQLTYQKIFFYGLPLLVTATIFLLPDRVYALGISDAFSGMEPACKVLKTNTDAHAIWKTLLTLVNSLIVALLIVVAFVEILHINVNTYGVKKILPTLILAVIAANFSYILVRFLVDLANIVITVFSENNKIDGMVNNTEIFEFPAFEWTSWFSNLIINLILLASGILMYVMAFLFLIRNWVIYFLAIVSPVAFMAMVLPQTKSLFNQWWQNIFRWVFMPVVSIGLLWLAAQMTPLIAQSAVMGAAIIGAILYFAIIMPFKLGGEVMSAWTKFTGAQWAAGKAKEYGATKAKGIGLRAWNNWQQTGLNLSRSDKGGVVGWMARGLGRNWLGNGLIRAKADLAHEDARSKGLEEGITARHYYNKGDKFQMEREYTKNRAGEIKEFESYAVERLIRKGMNAEAGGKTYKPYETLKEWRARTAQAKIRMSTADEALNDLVRSGTKMLMKELSSEATTPERKKELLEIFGMTDQEYAGFMNYYKRATTNKTIKEMEETKSMGDPVKDAMNEIVGAHNVAEFQSLAGEYKRLMDRHGEFFVAMLKEDNETLSRMNNTQRLAFEQDKDALKEAKRNEPWLKKTAIDMKAITREESENLSDPNIVAKMAAHAQRNYDDKIEQIQGLVAKNNNEIPLHLMDLISKDSSGNLQLKKMDAFAASRARIWIDKESAESAAGWVPQYGVPALSEAMIHGLPYESVEAQDVLAIHQRRVLSDRSEKNARKAAQVYEAVVRTMISGTQSQRTDATEGYLKFLTTNKLNDDMSEISKRLYEQFNTEDLKTKLNTTSDGIIDLLDNIKLLRETGADPASPEYTAAMQDLATRLQNSFKTASTMPGGGGTSSLLITSILGERARIGEYRV